MFNPNSRDGMLALMLLLISPLLGGAAGCFIAGKVSRDKVELAGLKGDETVLDLYCGIGTISLFFAIVTRFDLYTIRVSCGLDENGNVVEIKIIDFKSTTNNLENYIGQLTSYKSAIAKIVSIKDDDR